MNAAEQLRPEDIDYKIERNLQLGHTLESLRAHLINEMHDFQRSILRSKIQVQNYREQITRISQRIEEVRAKDMMNLKSRLDAIYAKIKEEREAE